LKTLGGIHETRKSKIKTRGIQLLAAGAKIGAESFALCTSLHSGPPAQPGAETSGLNLFDFRVSWNHLRFQVFMSK